MTGHNDITGDTLISKPTSKEYEEGWDRVFGTTIDKEKCKHDFKYDGHGHNYSVYKCSKCGEEEER